MHGCWWSLIQLRQLRKARTIGVNICTCMCAFVDYLIIGSFAGSETPENNQESHRIDWFSPLYWLFQTGERKRSVAILELSRYKYAGNYCVL